MKRDCNPADCCFGVELRAVQHGKQCESDHAEQSSRNTLFDPATTEDSEGHDRGCADSHSGHDFGGCMSSDDDACHPDCRDQESGRKH